MLPVHALRTGRAACRYERLQKIMILSVIKRTPARVKFWFIKNYMSPQVLGRAARGLSGTGRHIRRAWACHRLMLPSPPAVFPPPRR